MKLYEIDQAILETIDSETGEILDAERLDSLQMARTEKLENVACWVKNLSAEADALKAEKDAFAAREKAARSKIESLKAYLSYACRGEKLSTPKAVVSFRKSEALEIDNEQEFIIWAQTHEHDELLTYSAPKLDKMCIKAALKGGVALSGCRLVSKQNIQIK